MRDASIKIQRLGDQRIDPFSLHRCSNFASTLKMGSDSAVGLLDDLTNLTVRTIPHVCDPAATKKELIVSGGPQLFGHKKGAS